MNKNSLVLESLVEYCKEHPEERFWQAVRNWSGYNYVGYTSDYEGEFIDLFYKAGV